ncbi:S41 family peptidase [Pseudoalteromonas luteoviolacea]|uniref:S41 family peptidase n=1 Tax=Pseudoalteromonas luteoviolacea TaxID=43657 RepID=UPI001EEF561E|nr:S41 family peptidase [Pseudoalteromonas luteoviolacea]MCF6438525.1 S41 family peptidase [Pseudoalteromonas luteoviolacea]
MRKILIVLGVALLMACSSPQQVNQSKTTLISINALKSDLVQLKELLDSTHPDPRFTMDVEAAKLHIDELSEELDTPLSQLEAWKYMSQLNPFFSDGHMAIFYPELDKSYKQHIENRGQLFPIDIRISKSNKLYVNTNKYESLDITFGDEITKINGNAASDVVDTILSRMHGDSLIHRQALASDRFAKMFWLMYGDSGAYHFEIYSGSKQREVVIDGVFGERDKSIFTIDDFASRKILNNNIGYLRIDRFYYPPYLEESFFKFMEETWLAFKQAKVQDVIIDVRTNPGGTDHYWQRGIAPYVASKPFPFISKFQIRLTERNLKLGPVKGELGTIVSGPYEPLIPVSGKENHKIPGKAYLLMGPLSYSSTILFLSAFQDAAQAVIVGQRTGVRSCTTGRIQPFQLAGSQLEVTIPTAIFTRSAGAVKCHDPIEPDIILPVNVTEPDNTIAELEEIIMKQRIKS